jgi:hypothetical protein
VRIYTARLITSTNQSSVLATAMLVSVRYLSLIVVPERFLTARLVCSLAIKLIVRVVFLVDG